MKILFNQKVDSTLDTPLSSIPGWLAGEKLLPLDTALIHAASAIFTSPHTRVQEPSLSGRISVYRGNGEVLGATLTDEGINFAIHSTSKEMQLRIYDSGKREPILTVLLDSMINKTNRVWHVFIKGLPNTKLYYNYRNERSNKDILDPYARGVSSRRHYGVGDGGPDDYSYRPFGAVVQNNFDWEGDVRLNHPQKDLIIYEMHVRGFTRHPSSDSKQGGTFLAMAEPKHIQHLKKLGINAVELQPIHESNEMNYEDSWGYNTVNFFSPMNRYGSSEDPQDVVNEFKYMVRELHKNGIEVILDVVFNHTGEGGEQGPVLSFKALDNEAYYMLDSEGRYVNKSGCGNTLNCNNPVVQEMIMNSLRYWVTEMHVDGFRFDLASVFNRDHAGHRIDNSPLLDAIKRDLVLAEVKLISEPWDTEMQQLGSFTAHDTRWKEWNDQFRDSVRSYIKGDRFMKGRFAAALCGSRSIFEPQGGSAMNTINFVTAHDGFTLCDLISYNWKHNLANWNNNRDGCDDNHSWNCGVEGETDRPDVLKLRERQMRNLHLALMVSNGTPMVLMGDEYGHSKKGNNNTYRQDVLNQFNWDALSQNEQFNRFFSLMNHYRLSHGAFRKERFLDHRDVEWHGREPFSPSWDPEDPLLVFVLKGENQAEQVMIAFNPSGEPISITLPPPPAGKKWNVVINTSQESPIDFLEKDLTQPLEFDKFDIPAYTSILLEAKK